MAEGKIVWLRTVGQTALFMVHSCVPLVRSDPRFAMARLLVCHYHASAGCKVPKAIIIKDINQHINLTLCDIIEILFKVLYKTIELNCLVKT